MRSKRPTASTRCVLAEEDPSVPERARSPHPEIADALDRMVARPNIHFLDGKIGRAGPIPGVDGRLHRALRHVLHRQTRFRPAEIHGHPVGVWLRMLIRPQLVRRYMENAAGS